MSNDNIDFLTKYKYYFKKDNYNNVINDIIDHKVSKIYLDKKMNEIITLDNEIDDEIEKDIVSNSNYDYNYNYGSRLLLIPYGLLISSYTWKGIFL
jgi:hypothetical protein